VGPRCAEDAAGAHSFVARLGPARGPRVHGCADGRALGSDARLPRVGEGRRPRGGLGGRGRGPRGGLERGAVAGRGGGRSVGSLERGPARILRVSRAGAGGQRPQSSTAPSTASPGGRAIRSVTSTLSSSSVAILTSAASVPPSSGGRRQLPSTVGPERAVLVDVSPPPARSRCRCSTSSTSRTRCLP
jgi:hypothetical protein